MIDKNSQTGQIFELTDEEGNTYTFELLDFVAVDDVIYAVITAVDEETEDDEELNVVIMRTDFEDEEPVFTLVEDEEICKKVIDTFVDQFEDEENTDSEEESIDE